jgi:hypothetical protein
MAARPANSTLEDIGAALPRLAGRISARTLRIVLFAVVPTDPDLDIVSVAALIGRSFERVRQLCAAGVFGRKFFGKWRIGRQEVRRYLVARSRLPEDFDK